MSHPGSWRHWPTKISAHISDPPFRLPFCLLTPLNVHPRRAHIRNRILRDALPLCGAFTSSANGEPPHVAAARNAPPLVCIAHSDDVYLEHRASFHVSRACILAGAGQPIYRAHHLVLHTSGNSANAKQTHILTLPHTH